VPSSSSSSFIHKPRVINFFPSPVEARLTTPFHNPSKAEFNFGTSDVPPPDDEVVKPPLELVLFVSLY